MPQRIAVLSIGLLALLRPVHAPADEAVIPRDAAAYRQRIAEGALKLIEERRLYQEQVANETLEESLIRMLHEPLHFDALAAMRSRGLGDVSHLMNDPRVARVFGELAGADRATRTAMLERTLTELSSFLETLEAWSQGGRLGPTPEPSGFRFFPRLLLHTDDEGRSLPELIRWYDLDLGIMNQGYPTELTAPITVAIDAIARRKAGEAAATPTVSAFGPMALTWPDCEKIVDAARRTLQQEPPG